MSGYQYILLDKDPKAHIATLTLNRPDRRNALNDLMQDEIGDAVDEVEADKSIRVMVMTGTGSVFCAGGDLDQLKGGSQTGNRADGQTVGWISGNTDDIRRAFQRSQRFMLGLQRMKKRSLPCLTKPPSAPVLTWHVPVTFVLARPGLASWSPTSTWASFRDSAAPGSIPGAG